MRHRSDGGYSSLGVKLGDVVIPAFVVHQSANLEREPNVQALEARIPGLQRVEAVMDANPVVGCSTSQRLIIQRAVDENMPAVWIMEDDCVLTPHFNLDDWLATLEAARLHNVQIVVGGSANGLVPSKCPVPHLVAVEQFSSCHCWVAFQPVYDQVLAVNPATPIDVAVSAIKVKKAVRVPFIALQAPSYSSIELSFKDYSPWFKAAEERLRTHL